MVSQLKQWLDESDMQPYMVSQLIQYNGLMNRLRNQTWFLSSYHGSDTQPCMASQLIQWFDQSDPTILYIVFQLIQWFD